MIATAVLCPPAPFLVPGLAPRLAERAHEVVRACGRAVEELRGVDRIVVVSCGRVRDDRAAGGPDRAATGPAASGPAATGPAADAPEPDGASILRPGQMVSAAIFGRSDHPVAAPLALPGAAADRTVRRPHSAGAAIAAQLLHGAGLTAETYAVDLPTAGDAEPPPTAGDAEPPPAAGHAEPLPPAGHAALADLVTAQSARRVGLLVMADGAACHGDAAPGGPDPRSAQFDAAVRDAWSTGDPAALGRACAGLGDLAVALRAESFPAIAALAAATAPAGPASSAEILCYATPFGIGYLPGVWRWTTG